MKQAYNAAKNMPTYFDLRKILENGFIKDFVFDSYVSEKYIEELGVRKDISESNRQEVKKNRDELLDEGYYPCKSCNP